MTSTMPTTGLLGLRMVEKEPRSPTFISRIVVCGPGSSGRRSLPRPVFALGLLPGPRTRWRDSDLKSQYRHQPITFFHSLISTAGRKGPCLRLGDPPDRPVACLIEVRNLQDDERAAIPPSSASLADRPGTPCPTPRHIRRCACRLALRISMCPDLSRATERRDKHGLFLLQGSGERASIAASTGKFGRG